MTRVPINESKNLTSVKSGFRMFLLLLARVDLSELIRAVNPRCDHPIIIFSPRPPKTPHMFYVILIPRLNEESHPDPAGSNVHNAEAIDSQAGERDYRETDREGSIQKGVRMLTPRRQQTQSEEGPRPPRLLKNNSAFPAASMESANKRKSNPIFLFVR